MPKIIEQSISILSNAGLGMAMFSLGEYSNHILLDNVIFILDTRFLIILTTM